MLSLICVLCWGHFYILIRIYNNIIVIFVFLWKVLWHLWYINLVKLTIGKLATSSTLYSLKILNRAMLFGLISKLFYFKWTVHTSEHNFAVGLHDFRGHCWTYIDNQALVLF